MGTGESGTRERPVRKGLDPEDDDGDFDDIEEDDSGGDDDGDPLYPVDVEVKGGRINTVVISTTLRLPLHDEAVSRAELRRVVSMLSDSVPRAELKGLDEEHLEGVPDKAWDDAKSEFVSIPKKAREAWALQRKLRAMDESEDKAESEDPEAGSSENPEASRKENRC